MDKLILITLMLSVASNAFAWGPGHDDHAELVFERLPEEIQKAVTFTNEKGKQKTFESFCHVPDGSASASKKMMKQIFPPEDYKMFIEECGWSVYKFHNTEGRAAAFYLMTKGFRLKDHRLAAFAAGALLHQIGDISAFNHGPLIQHYTYTRYPHIKYPVNDLDLSLIRKNKHLAELIEKRLKGFKGDPGTKNLRKTIVDLMIGEYDACHIMSRNEYKLAIPGKNGEPSKEALDAMTEIAAWQTREGINAVLAAWRLAKSDEPLKFRGADFKRKLLRAEGKGAVSLYTDYDKVNKEKKKTFDIRNDSVYRGIFEVKQPPGQQVGILCEETWRMNSSTLGFSSKFLAAVTARALIKSGVPIRMLPVMEFTMPIPGKALHQQPNNLPSPKEMPVIIIFNTPGYMRYKLRDYIKKGGKLIFVGVDRDKKLTGLAPYYEKKTIADLPTIDSRKEHVLYKNCKLIPVGPFAGKFSEKEYPFRADPMTKAGWSKPVTDSVIKTGSPDIEPLFMIDNGKEQFCFAAAHKLSDGTINAVNLPLCALMPFLFDKDTAFPDWTHPELLDFSRQTVLESIKLLGIKVPDKK